MYCVVSAKAEDLYKPPIKSGFKNISQAYNWAKKNLNGNIRVYNRAVKLTHYDYQIIRKFQ